MLLPDAYQAFLTRKGHRLGAIGVNAVALSRDDALAALQALSGSQVAVLGGDVYQVQGSLIKVTRDSWYARRRDSESTAEYVRRTQEAAWHFVETYPDSKLSSILAPFGAHVVRIESYATHDAQGSEIIFAFVLSELGVTPITQTD